MKSAILSFVLPLLVVIGGVYWYISSETGNGAPLTTDASAGSPTQSQFQSLVGELSSISFDTSVFSNPHFAALVDLSTPIAPEPVGHADPFATVIAASAKK